ncbi:hypothetical protein TCAL_14744 [Tigriopus californicus]|uniref:C-type lectin domain-containing protein n=1 Tax=Tigriopus californicus TaxID=6832 RepID=A0A553PES2_TIGCA|nr:hypothetical protein TCAL_14744 [Tigriopus californicus]
MNSNKHALKFNVQYSATCPPQNREYEGHHGDVHYWLPSNRISFYEANNACQDHGMVLANVSTFEKLHQVLAIANGSDSGPFWVGIYYPTDYSSCHNERCNFLFYDIMGKALNYSDLNVPIRANQTKTCLQLNSNGSISSQMCEKNLKAICEVDCGEKAECNQPNSGMVMQNGRWTGFLNLNDDNGKSFNGAKGQCQNMNSNLVYVKQLRDAWDLNYVAKIHGGHDREAYIGLDPSTFSEPCVRWSGCPGLKWLDGTPYEHKLVHWEVTTNGDTSVGCFIVKHFHAAKNEDEYKIIGVNDCHKIRSFLCVSSCLRNRCPIPRTLKNATNNWGRFDHFENDTVE